jgi:drug/metabolite transporter (DMT)-like permease
MEAADGNVAVALVAPPVRRVTDSVLLVIAIGSVWIFWGSTFAGIKYAIETIPPFAMAAMRFTIAGGLLWLFCLAIGRGRPSRADWTRSLVTGASLLLFGNGVSVWATQYIPTGMGSLLLSLSPIWMALFDFLLTRERPRPLALAGMALGLAGMALLLQPGATRGLPLVPMILLIGASASWGFGSVYQRRAGGTNIVLATAMQMTVGGVFLGLEAALFGQWQHVDVHAISPASYGGLVWLIIFGSLVGYSAYLWTMKNAPIALGSTYAYVNPIVSLALGAMLFGEHLTPLALVASVVIIGGVSLMMIPARRPQ